MERKAKFFLQRTDMNVVYASNNDYAKYLGISMLSLFYNNQDIDEIVVYILSYKINSANREKLYTIANQYRRTLNFIDFSGFEQFIFSDYNTSGFNPVILSRLFLARYLPLEVERILYIDCDTVVSGSIKYLDEIVLDSYVMAAVPELNMPADKKKIIGFEPNETYYNSGVLLVNLSLWRFTDLESVFMNYYRKMNGRLLYIDQDILNHCCKGKILTLSHTYNLSTNLAYFPRYFIKKLQPAYDTQSADAYLEILDHPAIIHYMGDERPWIAGNFNKYRKQYEYYFDKSPWRDEAFIQGQRLYMFCYHILNVITLAFPWFRIWFSKVIGINKFKWFCKK